MSVELIVLSVACLIAGFVAARVLGWNEPVVHVAPIPSTKTLATGKRAYLILPDMNEVNEWIEKADLQSQEGMVNLSVVRTRSGNLELLTDFQRRMRAGDIAEVLYSTDEGFHFAAKAA